MFFKIVSWRLMIPHSGLFNLNLVVSVDPRFPVAAAPMPVLSLSKGRPFAGVGARSAQNLDLLSLEKEATGMPA